MAEFLYSEQFFFIADQILSPQEIAFNWSKILIRYKKSDNLDTKYHVNYEMRSNIAPLTDLSSRWVANLFPFRGWSWACCLPPTVTFAPLSSLRRRVETKLLPSGQRLFYRQRGGHITSHCPGSRAGQNTNIKLEWVEIGVKGIHMLSLNIWIWLLSWSLEIKIVQPKREVSLKRYEIWKSLKEADE